MLRVALGSPTRRNASSEFPQRGTCTRTETRVKGDLWLASGRHRLGSPDTSILGRWCRRNPYRHDVAVDPDRFFHRLCKSLHGVVSSSDRYASRLGLDL